MIDEVTPLLVGEQISADLTVEVDVLEYTLQGRVVNFECGKRLVQPAADLMMDRVTDVSPAGRGRHIESVLVIVGIISSEFGLLLAAALLKLGSDNFLSLDVEDVARPLQKKRTKDVLLELGGIHLAAKNVGRCEEMPFELGQGEH